MWVKNWKQKHNQLQPEFLHLVFPAVYSVNTYHKDLNQFGKKYLCRRGVLAQIYSMLCLFSVVPLPPPWGAGHKPQGSTPSNSLMRTMEWNRWRGGGLREGGSHQTISVSVDHPLPHLSVLFFTPPPLSPIYYSRLFYEIIEHSVKTFSGSSPPFIKLGR